MLKVLPCVALLMTASVASAQVDLSYSQHLEVGDKFRTTVAVETKQTLTLSGMNLDTKSDQFLIVTEEVTEKTGGKSKVTGSMEVMQTTLNLPGGLEYTFDSGSPDEPASIPQLAPLSDLFKALSQAEWITTIGENGKILSVKYKGDPLADVPEPFKQAGDPERFKQMAEQEIERLPKEPVEPGDTWERVEESEVGMGETLTLTNKYTYVGPVTHDGRAMHKITFETLDVKYGAGGDGAPLKITESDLEIESSEGVLIYDPKEGFAVDNKYRVHIKGDLTAEAGGNQLPGSLDLEISTEQKVERLGETPATR